MENFLCCVFLKILIKHINDQEKVDRTPGTCSECLHYVQYLTTFR